MNSAENNQYSLRFQILPRVTKCFKKCITAQNDTEKHVIYYDFAFSCKFWFKGQSSMKYGDCEIYI